MRKSQSSRSNSIFQKVQRDHDNLSELVNDRLAHLKLATDQPCELSNFCSIWHKVQRIIWPTNDFSWGIYASVDEETNGLTKILTNNVSWEIYALCGMWCKVQRITWLNDFSLGIFASVAKESNGLTKILANHTSSEIYTSADTESSGLTRILSWLVSHMGWEIYASFDQCLMN